jgi:hypothetical protein
MTTPVKLERCPVTDEDRQAAAALVRTGAPGLGNGNKVIASEIVGKLHDDYAIVQAFARHRAMHQASPIAEEIVSEEGFNRAVDILRMHMSSDIETVRNVLRAVIAAFTSQQVPIKEEKGK